MSRSNRKQPNNASKGRRHARVYEDLLPVLVRLGLGERAVLLAILLHLNPEGYAIPGYKTMAKVAGINESTVGPALKRLKAKGLIDWKPGGGRGRSNTYWLVDRVGDGDGALANSLAQSEGECDPTNSLGHGPGDSHEANTLEQGEKHPSDEPETPQNSHANALAQGQGGTDRTRGTVNNRRSSVVDVELAGGEKQSSESVSLLVEQGVSMPVADRLAAAHSRTRIAEVLGAARQRKKGAGWIVNALNGAWEFEPVIGGEPPRDPEEKQQEREGTKAWWNTLSREQQRSVERAVRDHCASALQLAPSDETRLQIIRNGIVKGRRDGWFSRLAEFSSSLELVGE